MTYKLFYTLYNVEGNIERSSVDDIPPDVLSWDDGSSIESAIDVFISLHSLVGQTIQPDLIEIERTPMSVTYRASSGKKHKWEIIEMEDE